MTRFSWFGAVIARAVAAARWSVVGLSVVGLSLAGLSVAQEIRFFRIGTGSTAGVNFPIGGLIASVISNPPGSRDCDRGGSCGVPGMIAVAQATQGSVENAREVGLGHLDAAIVQADIAAQAHDGRGEFSGKKKQGSLRALASLYPETLQIVVRRDSRITTLAGLKGKRVSLDTPGSGSQPAARKVLAHAGIRLADIKPIYVEIGAATDLMREGKLDGFFYMGGGPAPAIAQLAEVIEIHLVPLPDKLLERIRKSDKHYSPTTIPAATYNGTQDTTTLSAYALLLVNESLSPDLAADILRALWHKTARPMLNAHALGRKITLDTALAGLSIPLHPGARQYYASVGMLNDEGQPAE